MKRYVNNYLRSIEESSNHLDIEGSEISNSIILIETIDPVNAKNNLRSSKGDGRHNKYRLNAIKYALDKEEHTVKVMECMINNRWFQFKNTGEIITSGPYFSREVINDVCKEIFPTYELPSRTKHSGQIAN